MIINTWFPTLIGIDHLDQEKNFNQYLIDKAYEIKNQVGGSVTTTWKCDTFNTLGQWDHIKENDPVVNKLIDLVADRVWQFSSQFGKIKSERLVCNDFWFNIGSPGAYQEYHQHCSNHFSVVYYLKTNPQSGKIVLRSIESFADVFELPIDEKDLTESSYKTCFYQPKDSMVLIFKSNLLHMVEKNNSDTDRISIAMNFKFV
jgi:uncharacterized protein (TIGR02466 family)